MNKPIIKKWALSAHTVLRMEERKISVRELEQIIFHPDDVMTQGHKFIFLKKIKNRNDNLIAAVMVEQKENDLWLVITIMINFQKY